MVWGQASLDGVLREQARGCVECVRCESWDAYSEYAAGHRVVKNCRVRVGDGSDRILV